MHAFCGFRLGREFFRYPSSKYVFRPSRALLAFAWLAAVAHGKSLSQASPAGISRVSLHLVVAVDLHSSLLIAFMKGAYLIIVRRPNSRCSPMTPRFIHTGAAPASYNGAEDLLDAILPSSIFLCRQFQLAEDLCRLFR